MQLRGKAPAHVDPMKVFEWEQVSAFREGIISVTVLAEEATKAGFNWLLFYCWCYARTQGFTNRCMRDWDLANFGGRYKTFRDGVKDALSEFLKYTDTEMLAEEKEVLKLYAEVEAFCRGVVWTEPAPLPVPTPVPVPVPVPTPAPVPVPAPAPEGPPAGKPFWQSWKVLLGALSAAVAVASMFLPIPGWVSAVIKLLLGLFQ